jgi:pyrroline-5-carboxylate reductase
MKISIIGFGSVGTAFAGGLLKSGLMKCEDISVCAKSEKTRAYAKSEFGFNAFSDIKAAVKDADLIVFVLKAQVFNELLDGSTPEFFAGKAIISFMAGLSIDKIRAATNMQSEIVRAMPNLAIENNEGIVGYTKTDNIDILSILNCLGLCFEVPETDIEKITAFSACGLGFAAYILDAYVSAGKKLGLDSELCREITKRTFISAALSKSYADMVSSVATKGGATEQGTMHMAEKDIGGIIASVIQKAYDKLK